MNLELDSADLDWQARARELTEKYFFPNENELEEKGFLPPGTRARIKAAVLDYRLNAYGIPRQYEGQGCTHIQKMLIRQEIGKASGGMWQLVWSPFGPLLHGTPEQIAKYLIPSVRGERRGSMCVTEPGAGSDPRSVKTNVVLRDGKYLLNGEKWFVTNGDVSDFLIVHAAFEGDPGKPTLFLVDKNLKGVKIKRVPKFTHTFVCEHPEFLFENVELGPERLLGEIGKGLDLTRIYFTSSRLSVAACCVGAATRAADIANAYATEREQFGHKINTYQGVEFMLADMAVDIMAAKTLLYRVCWELDRGLDPRMGHGRSSAVKLYCSEMAGRVLDKAIQILGGRGYMRENPVERLNRDVRVDRIWEGTSEIQRMIIGGQIKKRGLGVYTGWV